MRLFAVKPIVSKQGALRIGAASLMCALASLTFGQQQPPPPPAEAPAQQQQNQAATAAPAEISPEDPDFGEPLGGFYWLTRGTSIMRPGLKAGAPLYQTLAMPSAKPRSPGAFLSIPAGKFNHLEISYFQIDGSGTSYAQGPLSLFGTNFSTGDFLSTTYRIRSAQLIWNYLTWPAPPEDSKFRFRTLWGFDYTGASPVIDAPFNPDPNFSPAHATRNIFYPALGVSIEYIPSKNFYLETRGWGFGIPHRADIADAEVNAVVRFKHLEIFGGYKLYHFKTSPGSDEYFGGTVKGPIAGLRWLLR